MKKVEIEAVRQAHYYDLIQRYENPIEHTCDIQIGDVFLSVDGKKPEKLCPEAWKIMEPYVSGLARGEGNFFDGWMKDPYSAMISCNDGFRPVSFYIHTVD